MLKTFLDIITHKQIGTKFFHAVQTEVYFRCTVKRFSEPLAHFAASHCSMGSVKNTQKRALNFFFVKCFSDFKISDGGLVKSHMSAYLIMVNVSKMHQALFLSFEKITQQST